MATGSPGGGLLHRVGLRYTGGHPPRARAARLQSGAGPPLLATQEGEMTFTVRDLMIDVLPNTFAGADKLLVARSTISAEVAV